MLSVSPELIDQSILIMGRSGIGQDEIEAEVLAIAGDKMLARRLIDCIQEAFGLVLVSHMSSELILPTNFSAKTEKGEWLQFKWAVEPVFIAGFEAGQRIFHNGPWDVFQNIALRSAMLNTVNNLLNAGGEIEGAVLSGPAMLGIPAEIYPKPKKSLLDRFFAWCLSRMRKKIRGH
jgi:hypothetical protein